MDNEFVELGNLKIGDRFKFTAGQMLLIERRRPYLKAFIDKSFRVVEKNNEDDCSWLSTGVVVESEPKSIYYFSNYGIMVEPLKDGEGTTA